MKFRALQENLRKVLWERIEAGELTGLGLAKATGFKQAHISNFLNHKRGLSVEGMDKVMAVQRLSVLDLLDPAEINKRASAAPESDDEFENVAAVEARVAARQPQIMRMKVKQMLKFRRTFLRQLRAEMQGDRARWQRFVVIRADNSEGMSMYPRLAPGAQLLIDRHYNSLKPYHKAKANMYAVAKSSTCTIKYVEVADDCLVLRPHNQAYPVELIPIERGKKPHDYLVGRVCHVGAEA